MSATVIHVWSNKGLTYVFSLQNANPTLVCYEVWG